MSTLPDIDTHLCIKGLLKTSTNSNFCEEYPLSNTPTNFKSSRKYRLRTALGSGFDLNEFCKHKLLHFSLWMFPTSFYPFWSMMKIKLDSGRRKWQIIAAESLMNTRLHVCCFPAGERIQPNTIYGGIICMPRAKSFNNKHNSTFKNETQESCLYLWLPCVNITDIYSSHKPKNTQDIIHCGI